MIGGCTIFADQTHLFDPFQREFGRVPERDVVDVDQHLVLARLFQT
jgi:hypothetical protein